MQLSIEEFKQLLASHQNELLVEGRRIEILRESCSEAWKEASAAERRANGIQLDLDDAHQIESELRGRLYDLETKLYNTSKELSDLQQNLGVKPILKEEQVRAFIRNTAGNQKIASIKLLRETLGLNLKEAKDLFEAEYAKGQNLAKPEATATATVAWDSHNPT